MAAGSVTTGAFTTRFSDLPPESVKKKIGDLKTKKCGFFGP
jgi:hypothetical protein